MLLCSMWRYLIWCSHNSGYFRFWLKIFCLLFWWKSFKVCWTVSSYETVCEKQFPQALFDSLRKFSTNKFVWSKQYLRILWQTFSTNEFVFDNLNNHLCSRRTFSTNKFVCDSFYELCETNIPEKNIFMTIFTIIFARGEHSPQTNSLAKKIDSLTFIQNNPFGKLNCFCKKRFDKLWS